MRPGLDAQNPYKNWSCCTHVYNSSLLIRGWERAESLEAHQPDNVMKYVEKQHRDPVPNKVEGED